MDIVKTLIETVLDWPVLLFGLIIYVLKFHGSALGSLLSSRKVDVELGGNKFSLGDAVEALSEQAIDDLKTVQGKLDLIEARVATLEGDGAGAKSAKTRSKGKNAPASKGEDTKADATGFANDDDIFQRLLTAISGSRFRWRSIERLALEAGVTEARAHEILARHHPADIVLGKSKTGRVIARLP